MKPVEEYLIKMLDKHAFAIYEWNTSRNIKVWSNFSEDYWNNNGDIGGVQDIDHFEYVTSLGDTIIINKYYNHGMSGWGRWRVNGNKLVE